MKLLVLILNKVEALDDVLSGLADNGIKGATIIDSTGMARALAHTDGEYSFLGSLRAILDPDREQNKTILMVLEESQISVVKRVLHETIGGLSGPDTGIMFAVPIDFVQGLRRE
ncbi:MAG: P-II family nitrogen regulator [Cellulosilyticaceae bacterium]